MLPSFNISYIPQDEVVKERIRVTVANAKAKLNESGNAHPRRSEDYYKQITYVPKEPVFIASTEGIGTNRVRANHVDALIDFYTEQEKLKNAGVPL